MEHGLQRRRSACTQHLPLPGSWPAPCLTERTSPACCFTATRWTTGAEGGRTKREEQRAGGSREACWASSLASAPAPGHQPDQLGRAAEACQAREGKLRRIGGHISRAVLLPALGVLPLRSSSCYTGARCKASGAIQAGEAYPPSRPTGAAAALDRHGFAGHLRRRLPLSLHSFSFVSPIPNRPTALQSRTAAQRQPLPVPTSCSALSPPLCSACWPLWSPHRPEAPAGAPPTRVSARPGQSVCRGRCQRGSASRAQPLRSLQRDWAPPSGRCMRLDSPWQPNPAGPRPVPARTACRAAP